MSELARVLSFDNSFVRALPADPDSSNRRRQVLGAAYSRVAPTAVAKPRLLAYSQQTATLLGLLPEHCQSEEFAQVFAGNLVLEGMAPYAARYGGHQFGNWAGQLGDGRAITLCEVKNARGERWELQLKGAGPTPYSRSADGRAVLRSSLREFLCSEAMHHLGVPTTRALSLIGSGEQVVRDMFYDGHPRAEPGAIVCRVAPSFLRFGNFELLTARRELELLAKLADYAIATHFPELGLESSERYLRLFEEISRRTLTLIEHWTRVGFVHGVMNTDNMSLLGLTIDYGPYGWLDNYDPDWTPNTTDAEGRRYRFGYQPRVALWNLNCLANALLPLVGAPEPLEAALEASVDAFASVEARVFCKKLALDPQSSEARELVSELPALLTRVETDMTIFFRRLADLDGDAAPEAADAALVGRLSDAFYAAPDAASEAALGAWLQRYLACARALGVADAQRRTRMNAQNPKYVLRNYLAQLAIDAAEEGDPSQIESLLELLRKPYAEQPEHDALAQKRPDWARKRAGCSMLSCSS